MKSKKVKKSKSKKKKREKSLVLTFQKNEGGIILPYVFSSFAKRMWASCVRWCRLVAATVDPAATVQAAACRDRQNFK